MRLQNPERSHAAQETNGHSQAGPEPPSATSHEGPENPEERRQGPEDELEEKEPGPEELAREEEEAKSREASGAEPEDSVDSGNRSASGYQRDASITLYLREIGRVKLLTPQEEIELAARIKKGDKRAREQMIKANLRLVVKIARDYEGIGLPLLDLISEGNIGLMKAVERFDPAKGGKLSTYGSWWIKQAMKRALANQSKTIRLPVHLIDKIGKMRRTALRLQEELGREPTDEELAAELDSTPARVAQMRVAAIRPASLDAQIEGENSGTYAETIADEKAETPYEMLEDKAVLGMLQEMVKTLDQREKAILSARFGLNGEPAKTLDEIGQTLGVTRERVRQLQNAALAKLRRKIEKLERSPANQNAPKPSPF